MSGLSIIGSGRHLPGRPYTNHDLARVMDTNDEWIRQRTGIEQRHFVEEGVGVAELAVPAARAALDAAGRDAEDVDYVLFNTMTPDHIFPGSGPLLSNLLGCRKIPALDLRAQCAAMVFSLQLADALLKSGAARTILVVGSEAHAGFMPWRDWDILRGDREARPSDADWQRATEHRSLAIIFGDGAGALVVESDPRPSAGVLAVDLHTDGAHAEQLYIPAGFRQRPYLQESTLTGDTGIPRMVGREVFKHAAIKLPKSVQAVCQKAGKRLDQVDWFIGHQANQRINDAVRERLKIPAERMPSNIARYGNTSAATIPILVDEMRRDGRIRPGQLICYFGLGAGLHWGSVLVQS